MHPGVAALSLEQQGFVLGTVLARRSALDALRLAGGGNAPWRAALEALVAQPRPLRAATVAELIGLVQAALPAGLERIHPGWLRERLLPEPSLVVRAVTDGLPQEVRRVAAEVLSERGETVGPSIGCPPPAAAALRRAVFGGFIPLAGPSAPQGRQGRLLLNLSFAAVEEAVELRGAATLGISLRGAPAPVIAQAAAGLGGRLARALLEAVNQRDAATEIDRSQARLLVSAAAGEMSPSLAMRLGLRAFALALSREGIDAVTALAQRLPPGLGRRLQALAAAPWD